MALTYRFTQSGRTKQAADELAGWTAIVLACRGTPNQANVDAVVTAWAGAAGASNPTAFNANHANYAAWRPAHEKATRRARLERQRQQQVAAAPIAPILPCHVDPALVLRQTLQIAVLTCTTSDTLGTRLGNATGRTIVQLLAHLEAVLQAMEDELNVRARHHEAQDLTIGGVAPIRVFVAPEWYFRPAGRAYTTAERAQIITGLEALSRAFTDWLIVPGTIYWSPDPPANPIVRVYNQCPILAAGTVLFTRTKRNLHDIPVGTEDHETWGMNNAAALPAGIAPASLGLALVAHRGRNFSLDICRDHFVGEAASHYAANHPAVAGSHVYIVTSNNTTIAPHFVCAANNGVLIHVDGSLGQTVHRIARVNGLDAVNAEILAYQPLFAAQRVPSETADDAKIRYRVLQQSPDYTTFRARLNAFVNPATTTNAAVQGPLVAGVPAAHAVNVDTRDAYYIEQVLLNNHVMQGVATTVGETNVMTPYFPHKRAYGNAMRNLQILAAPGNATTAARNTLVANLGAVNRALQAGLAMQPHAGARLYPLLDI